MAGPSFSPAGFQGQDPPRIIGAKILLYLADIWTVIVGGGGGGFPPTLKVTWTQAQSPAATAAPQRLTIFSIPVHKAFITAKSDNGSDLLIGGPVTQHIAIPPGSTWELTPPPGDWFDLNDIFFSSATNGDLAYIYYC